MKNTENEAIEIMRQLGLTFSQARIYIALVNSGESPARTISITSGVARAEVYRTMPSLQKLGLVEKVLTIPIQFKATTLQDGISILLKKENTEHLKIQKKATKLAINFKKNNEKATQERERQFVVSPGKDYHIKWLKSMYEKSQTTEGIITWKDDKTVHFFCEKEIKKATDRGLKSRIIVYVPEKEKILNTNDEFFENPHPNSQRRIVLDPPLVLGGMFDSKEVVIATTLNNPIQTSETVFWSANPSIIALFRNYFENLWETAK